MAVSDAIKLIQDNRYIEFQISITDVSLYFQKMIAKESISQSFHYEVELISEDHNIDIVKLLGEPATIKVVDELSGDRLFNGLISEFYFNGTQDRFAVYKAVVKPWFWFLTKTSDCRIFQNKTVPDIVKEVFRDFGFSDFKESLSGTYRDWEYCVQYRESAFDFVSRLLEQEGIYYYFEHEENKHTLVLADSLAAHEPCINSEEIPYFPPDTNSMRERDFIDNWVTGKAVQSGKVILNDYNYEKTNSPLQVQSAIDRNHSMDKFEVYDFPGEYETESEGNDYVRRRIEELQVQHESVKGSGNALQISVGYLFALSNYPRDDQNREYLVLTTEYELYDNSYVSGLTGVNHESTCFCDFSVMDSKEQYRPSQKTKKPIVQGPQTAVVVGQGEIHTNEYGSVKIQFHWDRYGELDDNSSCWVRVSQNWAGKDWGSVSLPHIGHEVIVEHLEGDPDRPIITGRVFNSSNMPPEKYPKCKTRTIWNCHGGNNITMEGDVSIQSISLFSPTFNTQVSLGSLTLVNDTSITINGYTCCTDGEHNSKCKQDRKEETGGDWFKLGYGFEHSTFFGWKSSFVGGSSTSFISGFQNSFVKGYSTSYFEGLKTSITKGRKFSHDMSENLNVTEGDATKKAPTLTETYDTVKSEVTKDYKEAKEKIVRKTQEYLTKTKISKHESETIETKCDEKTEKIAGDYQVNAGKNVIKCDKSITKASNIKNTGNTDFNNGALSVSK